MLNSTFFQWKLFHFNFLSIWLFWIPSFEKSHLTVEESSVRLHRFITFSFAIYFTFPKNIFGTLKDLFHRIEAVGHKIATDLSFCWFRIIVTLKIKDPIGVEMRMYWHMKGIRIKAIFFYWTISIECFIIALLAWYHAIDE